VVSLQAEIEVRELDETRPAQTLAAWSPFVEVPTRITVHVLRLTGRSRCANCQVRRVIYRIALSTVAGTDTTEARCRECWGMLR
jgi:hypothetical protein